MSAHDKLVGAATLKRLRLARGWSLADLARAIIAKATELGQPLDASVASVQRSVARWESSKAPILPGERYQLLLAHLYARGADGQTSIGAGSDCGELLDAFTHLGESEQRLGELRTLLVKTATDGGGGLLALLGPSTQLALSRALADSSRLDEGLLDAMRIAVGDVNGQVGSVPFVRVQLLLAPIVESCRRLLDASVPEALLPGLQAVAAQAYTLAGRAAFETRDDEASRALYAEATAAAGGIGSTWRRAVVHMSHALVTLYSTPGIEAAQRLVDAAVRDARAGESVTLRARAHALQAEIAARAGAERHAQAALALAWYDMDSDRDGDPASMSFSPAHLRGFEGVTSLYVGDPSQAHDYFARSAEALQAPRERVQRAIVSTDQALARIRLDEPESAAELLHGCIDAASETGGRVALIRLRRARSDLRPWRREDWFADLDDHLIDSLGA
jgi:transcriptional regulator with XRE-family HTH domain